MKLVFSLTPYEVGFIQGALVNLEPGHNFSEVARKILEKLQAQIDIQLKGYPQ